MSANLNTEYGMAKVKARVEKLPFHVHWGSPLPELSYDPGPNMRLDRRGVPISRGAGEVTLEDRRHPDPTKNEIVRGARRRNALLDLEARGTISKRQLDAAIWFLDDCSRASGGGLVANFLSVPTSPGPRDGIPKVQCDAITRVRTVFHLLGLNSGTVFWWVVFEDGGLRDYEDSHKIEHGAASRMLKAALTALDEHYNGRNTPPRTRAD